MSDKVGELFAGTRASARVQPKVALSFSQAATCSACVRLMQRSGLQEVLPKAGLVVSEKGQLTEILCKVRGAFCCNN